MAPDVAMTKIFVVGSYVEALTIRVPRQPAQGESLVGAGLDMGPGGKGTNQAIAAARLGADVRLLACVGDDVFGERALRLYDDEGLDTEHIHRIAGAYSGVGFVNVLPSGDNWITLDMGANLHLTPQHVADCAALIGESDILMAQFEAPAETVAAALALGKELGATTLLNPAPARPADPNMLANVDILTPNAGEARLLLGLQPDADVAAEALARRLLDYGVGSVVVTQGERGALVADGAGATHVPAIRIQAADVTGAGDSFSAALAVSLGEGLGLVEAARVAVRAGAYTALRLGVIAGLPTRAQLDRFP